VLKRFPFVLASALVVTAVCIALAEGDYSDLLEVKLIKIALVSSLGLPLFFAVHLFCEKWNAKPMFKFIALLTGLFLVVQFYFSLPLWAVSGGNILYRFFFWSAGLHLLAAFSVFFVEEELNGFWQFNKQLFLRFLTASLYSGVLYLGLAGAILAVDELFNLNLDDDLYADLWIVIAGLFNTIFFLGGIEDPVEELNNETGYPKGLKIFTQYVLLPLVTVYLLILYAYMAKIIALRSLPQGWVTNLILGFSVTGILSLLLVWPLREQEENKWIKTFTRFFYFSLVPLITLLFVAIGTRINAYGVTIERYIVAMLGVWLALITLYFIFSKRKNIILIPLTLALFLFGSCFGPWGMFAVSERSQVKRLKAVLERNGMLLDDKVIMLPVEDARLLKDSDRQQIISIIEYLSQQYGLQVINSWLNDDCRKQILSDSIARAPYEQATVFKQCLGIWASPDNNGGVPPPPKPRDYNCGFRCMELEEVGTFEVTGFDKLFGFSAYSGLEEFKGDTVSNLATLRNDTLTYYVKGKKAISIPVNSIAKRLIVMDSVDRIAHDIKTKDVTLQVLDTRGKRAKILVTEMAGDCKDSSVVIAFIRGYILLSN
nr:DUF4153 domain-containing protein [Chitinophagales bacterium]